MKIYHIKYIALVCCIFFFSCEDDLTVEPTLSISDNVALTSADNIKKLMVGTYAVIGREGSEGGYVHVVSDLLGADNQIDWKGTFFELRDVYFKTIVANNFSVQAIWDTYYKTINQCNLVIDNVDLIKDDTERATLEGEARFLRALSYFQLVRLYGGKTLGVPIRTEGIVDFAKDLSIARSTQAEVYALITADLQKARTMLPADNGFYANKYAAIGLIARINLYQGNFDAARDAASIVIDSSGKSLAPTFADAFNRDEDGTEDIFMMQVTAQSGTNLFIQFYASQANGGRGGDIILNPEYFALFDDPNDQRSLFTYMNEAGATLSSKYTNQFGNVPVMRLAEMYLIRAEANAKLGTAVGDSPLNDINALRTRSGATLFSNVNIDKIRLERQLELSFEGFGIYDVKRTGATVKGLMSDSPKLVLPIPQSEMDTNAKMEQNEGY